MPNTEANKIASESMREWFLSRYEDPVENTPYDSSEGGYIYIWGGPYEAYDELSAEFSEKYDDDLIRAVADELTESCEEWTRIPSLEDLDSEATSPEFFERFEASVKSIERELARVAEEGTNPFICALLFSHAITCLEAYLNDVLVVCLREEKFFKRFVASDEEFSKEKIPVSEVYACVDDLQRRVTKRIQNIIFHRLNFVKKIYKEALGIDFPDGVKKLTNAVLRRHDIVHRGCVDRDGVEFEVTREEVQDLLGAVSTFIKDLNGKVSALLSPPTVSTPAKADF